MGLWEFGGLPLVSVLQGFQGDWPLARNGKLPTHGQPNGILHCASQQIRLFSCFSHSLFLSF